jgi:hypothetical protein
VAGGDDDARGGAALEHLKRAHLRRDGVRSEGDRDVAGEQDLGGGGREMLGCEPPVIGNDDALGNLAALDDVTRHAIRAATDGIERELVGDPGSPAIRAEDDGRGLWRSADQRHLKPPEPNSAR